MSLLVGKTDWSRLDVSNESRLRGTRLCLCSLGHALNHVFSHASVYGHVSVRVKASSQQHWIWESQGL